VQQATRSRLLMLGAAVLWSTSGIMVKSPAVTDLPLAERGILLAFYRAVFATITLLPWLRPRAMRWRVALIPMVCSFAAMNLLYLTAMTRTTAAASTFLQYTSTVWTFLIGVLFLKETIDRGTLIALIGAIAGISWIVSDDWNSLNSFGNLIAIGSGMAYAGVIISLRQLRTEDAIWLVFLNHVFAMMVLLPWATSSETTLRAEQWTTLIFLGSVQMAIPYVMFSIAIRHILSHEAGLMTLIEPLLVPLWVAWAWHEPVNTATWVGGGLILGSLVLKYAHHARLLVSK